MKLSSRLRACAGLVKPGNVAADVGTDHGHLPIYLLENQICPRVIASDLREKPLEAAKRNAAQAGIFENIEFYLSNGLQNVPVSEVDTIIMAGMGGDTIIDILTGRPIAGKDMQLILQPQADAPRLRMFLGQEGYSIHQEVLARDGGFVYTIMEVYPQGGKPISPGESYRPQGRVDRTGELYKAYMDRVRNGLRKTIEGIKMGRELNEERLFFFETARKQLEELEGEQ